MGDNISLDLKSKQISQTVNCKNWDALVRAWPGLVYIVKHRIPNEK